MIIDGNEKRGVVLRVVHESILLRCRKGVFWTSRTRILIYMARESGKIKEGMICMMLMAGIVDSLFRSILSSMAIAGG